MDMLERNDRYYFDNEKTFRHPHDNVHFFVMSNYSIGMHKQEFFEINIITRGSGVHYIERNALAAEAGDVFIIPPEVEHGYKGSDGFDVYHILVSNEYIQKNFTELQSISGFSILFNIEPIMRTSSAKPLHLKLTPEQMQSIENLLFERRGQMTFVSTEEAFINTGAFLIAVTKLCRFYTQNTAASIEGSEKQDTNFMRALTLIHERYGEKITVERLAKEARMSRSTFMRKFLNICKLPPAEYIMRKRIEIAENMLINSSLPVTEIAEKAGFYDTAHFSKAFTKHRGCSPSEYRKNQNRKAD